MWLVGVWLEGVWLGVRRARGSEGWSWDWSEFGNGARSDRREGARAASEVSHAQALQGAEATAGSCCGKVVWLLPPCRARPPVHVHEAAGASPVVDVSVEVLELVQRVRVRLLALGYLCLQRRDLLLLLLSL